MKASSAPTSFPTFAQQQPPSPALIDGAAVTSRCCGHEGKSSSLAKETTDGTVPFTCIRRRSDNEKAGPCCDDSSNSSASTTIATSAGRADHEGQQSSLEHQLPSSAPSPSSLRSVRFNESIRCLVIPGVWQMPQYEIDDTWLSPTDSLRQKKDMKRTIRHMRSSGLDRGEAMDETKYCYRGLEHLRSAATLQRRQQEQSLAIDTVLEAQDASSFTPSYLAAVYEAATKKAKIRAILAAKRDEAEAMK